MGAAANTDAVMRLLKADRDATTAWDWLQMRWFAADPARPPHLTFSAVDPDAVAAAMTELATMADLDQVVYLDQSEHTVSLYTQGELAGEWVVATGTSGFPTPTGEYFVELKRENPTWGNPSPNGWGANLPAFIGPGPNNPLGVSAINWGGVDNIRFHGTNQEWSLGTDASHGCVRMANDDVVQLFDLVQVGARIISVE